jgi:hypothetical protein
MIVPRTCEPPPITVFTREPVIPPGTYDTGLYYVETGIVLVVSVGPGTPETTLTLPGTPETTLTLPGTLTGYPPLTLPAGTYGPVVYRLLVAPT